VVQSKREGLNLIIFGGSAHPVLTGRIAEFVGQPVGQVSVDRFPDGEIFVKIAENIRGQDIFIVQPTSPPNDNLLELLIMIDAAKRASADRITAVIPYYGYARQDRKDQPRVPITAKLVANLLVAAGTDRVLTLDLHAQQIQGFFDIPVDHLYASPVIVSDIRQKNISDLTIVASDPGSLKMAYAYSQMLNAGLAIVGKNRKTSEEVEAVDVVGEVSGCNCLIVDDMTTTAGTLCAAAELLAQNGAKSVLAAVSHAVLTGNALGRLKSSPIDELVTTDSVPRKGLQGFNITTLSVAQLLGEAIMRIHNNQSVTSLFKV
jgi:ribose-phosphate pyrophosphokinase